MLKIGNRVDIGENSGFEVYQFEQIEKRKGKVHLIVLKDGKRTFEKRVARAEEGTQKVYNFKFQGENFRLLIRK